MELRVDVRGDARIQANLRRASARMENPRPALQRAANAVVRQATTLAPKRTGHLSQRNRARVTLRTASVFNRVRYARYVEFGTRAARAQPFLRPALRTTDIGAIFDDYAADITNDI